MASPAREANPTAEPPSPPRFEQHHHEQRPHAPPLSPGVSLSAPHSTVEEASEATPGTNLGPSSPDSGFSCSPVVGSAAPVWPARRTSHGVRRSPAPGGRDDECENEKRRGDATAVVIVDPEMSRLNVDVGVEAGSGAVVRWICRGAGEGGEGVGVGDGREALAFSEGSGRSVDGQGQQQEAEGDRGGTEEPALNGAPSSANLTVTVVSDEVDEPQVTCQVPPGGGCCEKIFDKPGSYTYYVCSGPLTMGRVVATAPKCQAQSEAIAVDCSPAAGVKDSDAGEQGVEDLAVSEVASAKSDTAADGHSSEVCASQDERECRSAAEECGPETVEAGDSPGQDRGHDASHAAVAVDTLDMADAEQSLREGAETLAFSSQDFLGGGQCVDAVIPGVEGVAEKNAGEAPGAQSSCDDGASESRLEKKQAPNHPSPSGPLTPGEGNGERLLLKGADQEEQAPNHPPPSVPLSPCPSMPLTSDEGSSERLPLQGPEQDGSSLTGVPEIKGGRNGSRDQSPMSAVVTSMGSARREGDCERDGGAGCEGDVEVRSAADHHHEIGNGVDLYISSESDADQTITPQSKSPASLRHGTDDDVVLQPLGRRGSSRLSELAVFDGGGPYQGIAAHERTTECPSDTFPSQHLQAFLTADNAEGIFARSGGGSNSYDSDDVPRASCVSDGDNPNADRGKGTWERPSLPVSPSTPLLVLPLRDTPDRARGGASLRPAGSATAPQPQRSSQEGRIGRHRVEAMQRDGAGQEWKEISPLTSPAAVGGPGGIFSAFVCSEDTVPLPPVVVSDHGRKEQGSEDTVEVVHEVDEVEEEATPAVLEEAKVVVVAPLLEVGNESGCIMQTAMEALDGSDGDDSVKRAISPSTAPPMVAADNIDHLSSGSADEAVAGTDTAPNELEDATETAVEALNVSDGDGSVKSSRAISPSTALPVGAEAIISDVSSGSADEAAAETGTAPVSPANADLPHLPTGSTVNADANEVDQCCEDVSDVEDSVKISRTVSPSTAPLVVADTIDDASSGSADEVAAEKVTAPDESEGAMQTAREALDDSNDDGSVKASRAMSPSTAPPVGVAKSIGDVSSSSADEAAVETGTALGESEGPMPTAIEALDVSDGDGSAKTSRAISPSAALPAGAESIGDASSGSADEAVAETGTAPDESEGAMQTAMEALNVSDDDGSAKASRTIPPSTVLPVGAESIGDVSSEFADGAAAETGTAPDESEGAMQTAMEALDVSDGDGSVKASRAISPLTAPPAGAEKNIGDVSSDSADEAAAETGTVPNESEGAIQTAMEALEVSDGDELVKVSRAISPSTASPVGAGEIIGDMSFNSADEAAAETGTAPVDESEGAMQTEVEALDASDDDGSAKVSRTVSPSIAPPVGVAENIGDVSSGSADEAAAETGAAPVDESEDATQTAMEALDVADGDGSIKALRAISPSTAPPAGVESIGDVSSGSADEPAPEKSTAPDGPEGSVQIALEPLDVSNDDGLVNVSRAISPSTAPPVGVAGSIGDVSSGSTDETAAETGTAPDESEGAMQTAMEALGVSDSDSPAKASRAISPSTAPPAGVQSIGDVLSGSADEASAKTGTGPDESEDSVQIAMEALDVSDGDGLVKVSLAISPSTAPPVVAAGSIGDVSSDSADEAAAETSTAPAESEGTMTTAMEALDVSDDDGSIKVSPAISPSTAPPVGAEENVGDISSDSVDEAAVETDTAPASPANGGLPRPPTGSTVNADVNESNQCCEALDVSDGEDSVKASRTVSPSRAPPVGAGENIRDASSGSVDEVAAQTSAATDESEGAVQTAVEALDVSNGDGSVKASRAISPSTAPPVGKENIGDASSGSADGAAAETSTALGESEGAMQTAMEALDVSDDDGSAKASRAVSPSTAPPVGVENIGDVWSSSADEAASETGTAPDESEGAMQTATNALDVYDDNGSVMASRAISPSTAPPVGAESIGDESSGSANEAAAETGAAPVDESEDAMQTAMKALEVSDGDGLAKVSRTISPSTAPPVRVENIGDVSSGSADEAAAETGTAPDESEGAMQTAMEALDVSNDDCSVKSSRAISPSTAPSVGAESIGDASFGSADESAAEPGTAPAESEGPMQTAMEALNVSDGDGSVMASRATSPSTALPVGGGENIGDVSSGSADEAAAETGTAPDESEGAMQTAMETLDVSDGDSPAKASRAISPSTALPAGVQSIGDVSSGSADEAAAETGTAHVNSEGSVQIAMEALDVSDGDGSVKVSRAISRSTAPLVVADTIDDASSGSADETAAKTGTAPDESEGAVSTAMGALDVSDGDVSVKASRAIPPSPAPPVVAEESIGDVSYGSVDESAAETGTAPAGSEGAMQTAMEALDVSDGDGSAKASRVISPSAAPPVGAKSIGDASSDSADEAAAETGTAPDDSKGATQTEMEALDVADGDGSVKASRAISPLTAPPMGAEENIGDVSSGSADEAAAETGTASDGSEGAKLTVMEALDVSDGDGSVKASRATSPSTAPPVGAADTIDGASSGSADEAAVETGTAPDEPEGATQTEMEALDESDSEDPVKASCAISPAATPPVGVEENVGDVSSGSADEAAAETGTAPASPADGDMPRLPTGSTVIADANEGDQCCETLDVSDGEDPVKAPRATSPSTTPLVGAAESVGDVSSGSADEAAAETGTAPASPVPASPADGDLPLLPTRPIVSVDGGGGDQCCESIVAPLSCAAVESSDVAPEFSAKNSSPDKSNMKSGVECDDDCIHTMVVGDNSMQPFQPDVVRVPVGARVLWKRCSGATNDDEPEVFNVRQGCPIVETGWRTEFSFSIGGEQPTFIGNFEKAGRFVISSDASPPGADRKRGEVVVGNDAGHSDSDSFASPGDVQTSSEGFASGNEGSSFTLGGNDEGGFGNGSPLVAPLSMAESPRAPQDVNSNSCGSPASDGAEGRDCGEKDLFAASPTELSGDLHNSSATADPVHNWVAPALASSGMAIPPYVAVAGTKSRAVEPPFPALRRPRSLPPLSGAHGMSHGGRSAISDGRGWVPPNRLSVLEWSKGSHVAGETQRSLVVAASHECLRSPRLLSDTHAPAALPAVSGKKQSRGVGGGGEGRGVGADRGSDCGFNDTGVDDNRQSPASPAEASVQVEESSPRVRSACTPISAPNVNDGLAEPPQLAPEACETVQVEHEENDVVALSSAQPQEDEITAQPPPKTSQNKKKKAKKKKKKSGGGSGGGGGGDLGGDGGGGRTTPGSNVNPSSKVSVGEDNSAMLLDEETFSEIFGDCTTGVGVGGGKTLAKTLIVGDQGFKPWKPVLVQVGATVSIKAANVWPNGGIGQDRALSISLVGPVVHNAETKRFFEGSNKAEDMPDASRFKKTAPFGRALVAVFRKRGEYWLVDHLAGKRIKVTAVARETAPVALVEPGQPTLSGKQGSASSAQDADSVEATQRRGRNNGGETTSRSKKKSRGNDKLSEATALVKDIDATSVEEPEVALKPSEVAGSAGVSEPARDADLSASNARGVVDGGSGEVTTTTSTTTVGDDLLEQARERTPSPRLLPPVRVMLESDLSLDDFAWFTKFDAVHVVRVSYRKGFEPATLEVGLSPGLGALVVCELDMRQRVTREVLCRWLPGGAGDALGAAHGREEVDAGTASRAVAASNDVQTDSPMELATRLGPGCLKKCHLVLGRFGEYQVSFRDDIKMGLAVVVKPPKTSVASPVSPSAFNTSVACEAGLGEDSVHGSSQVQPSEGPRSHRLRDQKPKTVERNSSSEVAGDDGSPDSAEAHSDEDSADVSGSTTSSAEITLLEKCPIDNSSVVLTQVRQDVAGGKSVAVAAVGDDGFCWEDAMADRDQGDFVQQRSHVKRIKRHKIRSERAEAAKNAAAAAALLAAAAATAEAAAAATVVGKPPHAEEAALTSKSVVPGSPATEADVPTATGLPADTPTLEESRTAKSSSWEAKPTETSSQRVMATDKVASSVNSCLDQKPPRSPVVSAKAGVEVSTSPGAAVVGMDVRSFPAGESGRVEETAAKPIPLGRRKGRKHFDGENLGSPRKSAPAEPVIVVVTGPKTSQRKREVREDKSGGVRVAASTQKSTCATSIEPAQDILVAEKIAAAATGWGVAISGASWSDDVGPTQSEVRAGVPPEGCNASRAARAAPRPYSQQSLAAPPRVPYRRWDAPRATAFSQPYPPPQSSHGRGWKTPISGSSARPAISNWKGASVATAPLGSTADHNYSPSCVEGGGRHAILKESTGTAPESVALAPSPAEVAGLAGPAETLGVPTIADSKENTRVANPPSNYSHQASGAGRATSSTDPPGVVGVGNLPSAHFVARDRASDLSHEDGGGYRRSHEQGGGYGRRSRTGTESTRSSSRTSAHSRSGSFSSGKSDATPSAAGSNPTTSSKQKSKKKAKAERKVAHAAAAGALVVDAAFSGELKSSATPEPSAGQLHVASSKPMARSGKTRKNESQAGSSSRSGLSFGDFVLPAKSAAGRAGSGGFGSSAPSRRDAAGDRPPAAVAASESSGRAGTGNGRGGGGEEKNAGAGHGRGGGGEASGGEVKKNATSGEDAKGGQASRGRSGPARRATDGGWGGADAAPVLKSVPAGVSSPPPGRGDRPARPPPYEQPTERGEDSASEGSTVGNPGTLKGAALSTGVVVSPAAARSPRASDSSSGKPRWGNCSTKISFEERSRRSQALKGTRLPRGHRQARGRRLRPATFPEDSRLPGGGYSMPEGPEDRLPPPSAYEVEESARMMKLYDDMVDRLNTTGLDKKLPDGFTPKIYDLTKG